MTKNKKIKTRNKRQGGAVCVMLTVCKSILSVMLRIVRLRKLQQKRKKNR